MRILYDLTPAALTSAGNASGISRATAEVAGRLASMPDLDLAFTATGAPSAPLAARRLLDQGAFGKRALAHDEATIATHETIAAQGSLRRATGGIARALFPRRRPAPAEEIPQRWLQWAEVFHSTFFPIPLEVRRSSLPRVVTLYDVIPLLYPEHCTDAQIRVYASLVDSLDVSTRVIVNSRATAAAVEERVGIAAERITVIPLAASPQLFHRVAEVGRVEEIGRRYGTGPRYLLALSTLEPRKNLERLVRVFLGMAGRGTASGVRLVLAGDSGWKSESLQKVLESSNGRVVATGFVDEADLAPLYSGATAFVFPSLYEGFGLPPLEAMQCGTPVIASNRAAIPEVVGDAALLVDPEDDAALEAAMLGLLNDGDLRRNLAERGLEQAARFSWEETARKTLEVYDDAIRAGRVTP